MIVLYQFTIHILIKYFEFKWASLDGKSIMSFELIISEKSIFTNKKINSISKLYETTVAYF